MKTLDVVELILSVAGLLGTIYFGLKSEQLKRRLQRFEWADIAAGVSFIRKKSKKFQPQLMLSVSVPGAIISNLFLAEHDTFIPLYSAVSLKTTETLTQCRPSSLYSFSTSKWTTFLPPEIFAFSGNRLLICDDCVLTGDSLEQLLAVLTKNGFQRKNICTASLFVSQLALDSGKAPDIYWMKANEAGFYMPWGKSMGRGY